MSILLLAYLVQNEVERICAFGLWVQMKLKEYVPLDYEWCGTFNLGETSLYHYRINFVLELSKLLSKLLTREGSGGCSQRATLLGHVYDRGWDGWMASLTRWTWVWVDSGSWWWTGRPGVLRFMGSQRVAHDWATELNWTELGHWYPAFNSQKMNENGGEKASAFVSTTAHRECRWGSEERDQEVRVNMAQPTSCRLAFCKITRKPALAKCWRQTILVKLRWQLRTKVCYSCNHEFQTPDL